MRQFTALVILSLLIFSSSSRAADSLGFDVLGGVGTDGYDLTGSLDLHPDSAQKPWTASVTFAHEHTTVGSESRSNQIISELAHVFSENVDAHAELNFWKDDITGVRYLGPTAGFTYTWLKDSGEKSTAAPAGSESARASEESEASAAPPPQDEAFAVSLNTDLFFYSTDVQLSSATRTVFDRNSHRFTQKAIPPQSSKETVAQFHPNAGIEVPLFDAAVTPYLLAGFYLYSKDPSAFEDQAGRPRFAVSTSRLNGLVGGFLKNSGEGGVRLALPADIDGALRLGAQQQQTDNTWSTTQGLTLERNFWDHVRMKLDWTRTIQAGDSSDVFTGGLTYNF